MAKLDSLVTEYLEADLPRLILRRDIVGTLPTPQRYNPVTIITGMRRTGKTFYMFQKMSEIMKSNNSSHAILYFDFSDDRLRPLEHSTGQDVIETFYRLVPEARTQGAYLFLDEIQELDDWQALCRRLAERENVTLVVTGSSSKLSSEEISTEFRGRSLPYELLPLSFAEFCAFDSEQQRGSGGQAGTDSRRPQEVCTKADRPQGADSKRAYSTAAATAYEGLYDRYLIEGGFPGVQRSLGVDSARRLRTLQGYVRDVVARDVAERSGREDLALANRIALYALRNTSCELTVTAAVGELRNEGRKIYWEKADRLVSLLEQAFLFHKLYEYTRVLSSGSTAAPKVYANDPSLSYAVARANQQDVGKRFETAIYLELRRRLADSRIETVTSYTSAAPGHKKVDFLVGDALSQSPYELYQACADMTAPKTRKREVESLRTAMEETHLDEGYIITLREEEDIETPAGLVHVVPAWKWSLG